MTQAIREQLQRDDPPAKDRGLPHSCEECGSVLDVQQRYCVRCGTRNRNAPSPAADYFSGSARRRRPAVPPAARGRGRLASSAPALLLVILPVAVAVGVLVGKSGSGNIDQKLIDALRNQRPVAQTTAGAPTVTGSGAAASASKKHAAKGKGSSGKVLSHGKFGSAHQVTGAKPSGQKVQSDTNLVKNLQKQTGKSYVQHQQGLPDTIVVGK